MTVNHFSAVANLIAESDLISVVPPTTLEKAIFSGKLAVTKPPVDIQGAQLCSHWHKRQEKDGGLCWLRKHVNSMVKEHAERHFEELKKRFCGAKAA